MASKDEVGWIKTRVIPLLRNLGFRRVDFVHGSMEAGRDIVMANYDRFGLLKYYAVQAKDGDLRARSDSPEINTIFDQVRTAFETSYRDPLSGTEHKIAGVYLVVNGSITDAARNILYSKTGGWFSIVDLSQLEIAPLLSQIVTDEDRRMRLLAMKGEISWNRTLLSNFINQFENLSDKGGSLKLLFSPLRTRYTERYLDIGYYELDAYDIAELDILLKRCDFINFNMHKIPLGLQSLENIETAISIKEIGEEYVELSYRLDHGINELLDLERPAPGDRFDRRFFFVEQPSLQRLEDED